MGQVRVKSYRRGKSVVRAYLRAGTAYERAASLLYGKDSVSPERQKQLHKRMSSIHQRRNQLSQILEGKLRTGAGLMGGKAFKNSRRYFSSASLSPRLNRTMKF